MSDCDAELVCECGVRFRCPRCDRAPQLRLVASGLLDRRGRQSPAELQGENRPSGPPPESHRFATRDEPDEATEAWLAPASAAELLGLSPKSFALVGGQLAEHVRRKRIGRAFHYYRPDVLEICEVREQCKLSLDGTLRTYAALVERRL